MPTASTQVTFRTLVTKAKQAIKQGELTSAKDLLDAAIDSNCYTLTHLKAKYLRATVMFGLGDYAAAQAELELCLNHLVNHPPAQTDLVVDCLFLWFWATKRQNYNPRNQQSFMNLVFSKFPQENLREKLTQKKTPPKFPKPPTANPKQKRQVRVSC